MIFWWFDQQDATVSRLFGSLDRVFSLGGGRITKGPLRQGGRGQDPGVG